MPLNYFNKFIGNKNLVKRILSISATFFLLSWAGGLITPVLNIYINDVTGNLFLAGLVISLMGLTGIILSIPCGILCDKYDTKRLNQVSILVLAIVPILFIFSKDFYVLFAVRLLEAIFSTLLWASLWTHVYRVVDNAHTGSEVGFLSMSFDVASTISPIIGGIIATFALFLPFYLWSIFTFAAFLLVTFKTKSTTPDKIDTFSYLLKKDLALFSQFVKERYASTTITIFSYLLAAMVGSFLPILLYMSGMDYSRIGLIFAVTFVPVIFLEVSIGKYVDKVGRGRALLLGLLTLCLCTIGFSITLNFYFVLVIMVFFGVSQIITFIAATSIACDLSGKDGKGLMSGARKLIMSIGVGLGPLLGGLFFSLLGRSLTLLIFAGIGILMATMYLFFKGETI